jgi:peptide/nickel transport system ATP-binding protein
MNQVPYDENKLLEVKNLSKEFAVKKDFFGKNILTLKAVSNLSFSLDRGECLTLVGESGCGKSTTARLTARLLEADSGEVFFNGRDLLKLKPAELRKERMNLQMVFQNPYSSLDPRYKIFDLIAEPLEIHWENIRRSLSQTSKTITAKQEPAKNDTDKQSNRSPIVITASKTNRKTPKPVKIKNIKIKIDKKTYIRNRVFELLNLVELDESIAFKYPHQCSGGQNQRIGIARALALNPSLIIADEAVSALDVSVQWKVLNILKKLQREMNISFLFIAHNLGVVKYIADTVAVMYLGEIVEIADKDELFSNPLHPYTKALLSAAPIADPTLRYRDKILLEGDIPKPTEIPSGCPFHTRCYMAEASCSQIKPSLENKSADQNSKHLVSCLLS